MCTRSGKDINGQMQYENSIFPRFGRSNRSSEKLSAIAKSNFQKSKATMIGKESEVATAAIVEHDKDKNATSVKTTPITITNHYDGKNHIINGVTETSTNIQVQRSEVLHTDL
jgi:hypothetical protein